MTAERASIPERKGAPNQYSLGLEHLTPDQRALLDGFIDTYAIWLDAQYDDELQAVLRGEPVRPIALDVEALGSGDDEERCIAAGVIAEVAEVRPDVGFPLWVALMQDWHGAVRESAMRSLLSALGRRDLNPSGVMAVIEAHYAIREAHEDGWQQPRPYPHQGG